MASRNGVLIWCDGRQSGDVLDLPEDCPSCFGMLTLREIPEDALASFDMKLNRQDIRVSFRCKRAHNQCRLA